MTEDEEPEPDSRAEEQAPPRAVPKRRDDSEKAIGLEMARLFGLNPKLMMAPKQPKTDDREDSEPEEAPSE
jgi:hypothetical protein